MRLLLPAVSVWSQFDYFSQPTHCCWQPCMRANCARGGGKAPAGDHFGFLPWYLSPRLLPSFTTEDTGKCIMILWPSNKECCCSQPMHMPTDTDTRAYLRKRALYILQLVVAYRSDRWLDCSWPLTCSLCSGRSDFILGNMRWALERVHDWGKEALHTVELHISVWPRAFSPSQLSAPSLPEAPSPGLVHSRQVQCLGGPPPASMQSTQPVGRKRPSKKCIKGLWAQGAQCKHWWWRRRCDANLPLTHKAVKAQTFTISKKLREDASVTCQLDWTDKPRGWTDRHLTLSMNAFHTITVA